MLDQRRLAEFAERGYLVVPGAVRGELLEAATRVIDDRIEREPPEPGVRGPHFYWPAAADVPALLALLTRSPAFGLAGELAGPDALDPPDQVQIALNIPPFPHLPGIPHIDGAQPTGEGYLPSTFTLLAGVLLSDQLDRDGGNLWIWPGTHLRHAAYFREHGPDAFFTAAGYPPIDLPKPVQLTGRAGDLLLAHYLLGHNIGGNTAAATRRAVYFRLKHRDHDWRTALQDPWADFAGVPPSPGGPDGT